MNKKILGLFILIVGIVTTVGVTKAFAYQGDFTTYGPNHTEEREADMETVMEEKDYEGWVDLMTEDGRNPGVLNNIDTQEEFDQFAEAYVLAHEGKVDEANAIRSELGLGNGQGNQGGGQHRGGNGDGSCNLSE